MKKNKLVLLIAAVCSVFSLEAQNISYVTFPSGLFDLAGYSIYNTDNSKNDSMFVQRFKYSDFPAALSGTVNINSIKGRYFVYQGTPDQVTTADLVIYTSNNGMPDQLIYSQAITVANTDNGDGSFYKDITTPVTGVTVTTDFYVGIRTNGNTDKVAFYVGQLGCACDNIMLYGPSVTNGGDDAWRTLISRHSSQDLNMYMELNVSKVVANVAPTPVADVATTPQDTPVVTDVLANDSDPDGTLDVTTVTVTVQPSNGTTSVDPVTGAITYTPNAGYVGTDVYTYQVCDKGSPQLCATATVTITVTAVVVNEAPVAVDDAAGQVVAGGSASFAILANDTDQNETVTSLTHTVDLDIATAGVQNTFTSTTPAVTWTYDSGTGMLTCSPALGVTGPLTITYRLCDGGDLCDDAVVTFDGVAGIEELVINAKVYPNPVKDFIRVESTNQTPKSAKIVALNGVTVADLNVSQKNMSVPSMEAGMYILEVTFENGAVSRTSFMKE